MDAGDLLLPSQVLDLAVLGVTSERARTAAELVAAVKEVGTARFQPVTDVIVGRVGALAEAGLLSSARTGSGARSRVLRPRAGRTWSGCC